MTAVLARQHLSGLSRAGGVLALILFFIGTVFSIILLEHAGVVHWHWLLQAIEMALALVIAPLILYYVSRALNIDRPPYWIFLPLVVFVLYAIFNREHMFAALGYGHIIIVQLTCLFCASYVFIRWKRSSIRNIGELESAKYVGYILFFMFVIHLAETLRTLFPYSPYLRDVVPLVGAISVLLLTFFAMGESRAFNSFAGISKSRGAVDPQLFTQLKALVELEELYLRTDLSIDDIAAKMNLGVRALSRLINESTGESFIRFINAYRLEYAKAMLESNEEARTSIEAIGLSSGFGSRSAFYAAFSKKHQVSPAKYRKTFFEKENVVLKQGSGQPSD
jgi:AraC-like DNA-binding protein